MLPHIEILSISVLSTYDTHMLNISDTFPSIDFRSYLLYNLLCFLLCFYLLCGCLPVFKFLYFNQISIHWILFIKVENIIHKLNDAKHHESSIPKFILFFIFQWFLFALCFSIFSLDCPCAFSIWSHWRLNFVHVYIQFKTDTLTIIYLQINLYVWDEEK